MGIVTLQIHSREPYAGGEAFGDVGPYERLDGTLTYAVDPEHEVNRVIVDLDKAPRDADGRVRFSGDFCLLMPADPAWVAVTPVGYTCVPCEEPNRGFAALRMSSPIAARSTTQQGAL